MTDSLMVATARARIQETAEAELPARERLDRLREVRAELEGALEDCDAAIVEADLAASAEAVPAAVAIAALRELATVNEQLVAAGTLTEAELAGAGALDHADLDALDEEGLLEATAIEHAERMRAGAAAENE